MKSSITSLFILIFNRSIVIWEFLCLFENLIFTLFVIIDLKHEKILVKSVSFIKCYTRVFDNNFTIYFFLTELFCLYSWCFGVEFYKSI